MNGANTAVLDMSQEFQQTGSFAQKQAEILARAIYKSREDLATKKDLDLVRNDLEKCATKKDLDLVRKGLKTKASKKDLETGLNLLRLELSLEVRNGLIKAILAMSGISAVVVAVIIGALHIYSSVLLAALHSPIVPPQTAVDVAPAGTGEIEAGVEATSAGLDASTAPGVGSQEAPVISGAAPARAEELPASREAAAAREKSEADAASDP